MSIVQFKKGTVTDFEKLKKETGSLSEGALYFAEYNIVQQNEFFQSETLPVSSVLYLKEDKGLIPIIPPSDISGRLLCTQGINNPVQYSSNIVLGGEQIENSEIYESGSITIANKANKQITIKPYYDTALNSNNNKYYYNNTLHLPLSKFYTAIYPIWSNITQPESEAPVAGSPNWPIYVNNEGMVVKCDPTLGTKDNRFEGIHVDNIIFKTIEENFEDDPYPSFIDQYGLVFNYLKDENNDEPEPVGYFYTGNPNDWGWWLNTCWYRSEQEMVSFDLWQTEFDINYSGFVSIKNEEIDYSCGININADTNDLSDNWLKLKGNICIDDFWSYSSYPPTDSNCPLPNLSDPYEGQIYFTLLS